MAFNLPELKAFVAVARTGSFTAASAQLHLSQPALSRRIGLIEQSLGAPLFDRHPDGARLTEPGRAFLPHAEAALTTLQDGIEAAQGTTRGERGQVSLAVIGALCNAQVVGALDRFRKELPGIDLSLSFHAGTSSEVSEQVLRGEASLGLRYRLDDDPRLECEQIGEETMLICCAPRHTLAREKVVTPEQLAEQDWIAFPMQYRSADSEFWERLSWYELPVGRKLMRIDSTSAQKRLLIADFGVGLLPTGAVQEELQLGELIALNVPAMRAAVPVTLVRRKAAYVSSSVARLAALLGSVYES
jgi:DNA-binding transcriptional LysR family regulator